MDVLVRGLETKWVSELKKICSKNNIFICEKETEAADLRLLVTDYPIEWVKQGAYAGIPFVVVSKDGREEKILEAFEAGAEDYMVFPVSPDVAGVRIFRILGIGRAEKGCEERLREGAHFTPNEYRILSFMMGQPGRVFTRDELLAGAFPGMYKGYDRNVDNYIKEIRKKLSKRGGKLETVYGVGYRFMQ